MKKYLLFLFHFFVLGIICYSQCSDPTIVSITIDGAKQSCENAPITFAATTVGGGTSPTYQWYLGTIPVGDNSPTCTITPTIEDNGKQITATLISSEVCNTGIATSNILTLNLSPSHYPSVTIKPYISATCSGDSWSFTVSGETDLGTDPTPQWYLNGVPLNLHNRTVSVTPQNGDEIYVITTSSLECTIGSAAVQSNIITIEVTDCGPFSLPISGPILVQSRQSNVVYSVPNLAGSSYDWEVTGGTIVKGQNTNSITVDWGEIKIYHPSEQLRPQYYITLNETNGGNFTHTTTIDIGPIATSVSKSLAQSGITLFPNPTTESFNIEMPESGVAVSYEILDLTGASVARGNFTSTGTAEKITTNFGAGMYQLVLRYNDVVTSGRLSKVQ